MSETTMQAGVRVRMAPSPTGNLHLGTAYTTLFNYLYARRMGGSFILRIEDTDQARTNPEFEKNIIEGLKWLGLNWDEGPFHQIDRLPSYKSASERLIKSGKAYYCFCTSAELEVEKKKQQEGKRPIVYSGKCRSLTNQEVAKKLAENVKFVVRLRVPEGRGVVKFNDLLHGEISFDSNLLGDMVIMRGSGVPLYNFAVVVDDIDMNISHVLRGDDHISNTPKQILIFEALDADIPKFAHWPMILNPDRIGKLSKRANATSIEDFRKDGFLPETILNYFSLLGWTMPDDQEIISLQEMEETFDLSKMRLSGAAFNMEKLEWLNGEYIRKFTDDELTQRLQEYLVDHPDKQAIAQIVPLIKERIKKLSDFIPLTDFFFEKPEYDFEILKKLKIENIRDVLIEIKNKMESLPKPWSAKLFEQTFRDLAEELSLPVVSCFQLIRIAVSGKLVTPPLFESIEILGNIKTLERINDLILRFDSFDK